MKGVSHVLFADGSRAHLAHDKPPTLEWQQGMVGGWLEHLSVSVPFMGQAGQMFMNEDGPRLKLPINLQATELVREATGDATIVIRGDVLIFTGDEEFMEEL